MTTTTILQWVRSDNKPNNPHLLNIRIIETKQPLNNILGFMTGGVKTRDGVLLWYTLEWLEEKEIPVTTDAEIREVLKEADEYLSHTTYEKGKPVMLNSIGAGSVLHRKITAAYQSIPSKEVQETEKEVRVRAKQVFKYFVDIAAPKSENPDKYTYDQVVNCEREAYFKGWLSAQSISVEGEVVKEETIEEHYSKLRQAVSASKEQPGKETKTPEQVILSFTDRLDPLDQYSMVSWHIVEPAMKEYASQFNPPSSTVLEGESSVQIGEAATADFEENTWTFEMSENFMVKAGKFAIVPIELFHQMSSKVVSKERILLTADQVGEFENPYGLIEEMAEAVRGTNPLYDCLTVFKKFSSKGVQTEGISIQDAQERSKIAYPDTMTTGQAAMNIEHVNALRYGYVTGLMDRHAPKISAPQTDDKLKELIEWITEGMKHGYSNEQKALLKKVLSKATELFNQGDK